MIPERLSIELTNQCKKGCWFCYSASTPSGETRWTVDEVVALVTSCASAGTKAVSFGGGEPLEYPGTFELLRRLDGVVFRSMTTNGLLLDDDVLERLALARIDKVHVSIHFASDTERVVERVHALEGRGIRSGINLLVPRSRLDEVATVAKRIRAAGISNERIVYLPMRIEDTPSPEDVARVAGGPFQSMTCLSACAKSPRFASIGWDKSVAWCSYTKARRPLEELSSQGLERALFDLGLDFCGGNDGERLVRLSRRPLDGHGMVRGRP